MMGTLNLVQEKEMIMFMSAMDLFFNSLQPTEADTRHRPKHVFYCMLATVPCVRLLRVSNHLKALLLTDECMSSGTYTEPLNYATNFNVPLLIHIVVCSSGLNHKQ